MQLCVRWSSALPGAAPPKITGYDAAFRARTTAMRGGGIGFYIRQRPGLTYTEALHKIPANNADEIEAHSIKITIDNCPLMLTNIYCRNGIVPLEVLDRIRNETGVAPHVICWWRCVWTEGRVEEMCARTSSRFASLCMSSVVSW
jgi:hypothetical protein